MSKIKDLKPFGHIKKTFGYKGEVILSIKEQLHDSVNNLDIIFINIDEEIVPFFSEYYENRSDNDYLVKFDDIDNPETAKNIISREIYLSPKSYNHTTSHDALSDNIIDFAVKDETHGFIGNVNSIIELKHQSLLLVLLKKREVLIPIVDEIILNIDTKNKTIFSKIPDGLLNINNE